MFTSTFPKRTFLAVAVCAMLSLFTLTPNVFAAGPADDLAPYKALAKEILQLVKAGNMKAAVKKGAEIEDKWDANTMSGPYPDIDEQMDTMNDALKSGDAKKATAEVNKYLAMLDGAVK
jgi:hypothetical protein